MSSIHKASSFTGDREPIPAAGGAALLANQSHLNGADVSGTPKGLVWDGSPVLHLKRGVLRSAVFQVSREVGRDGSHHYRRRRHLGRRL